MNIKFYDFKTKAVTEIPATELAPGCVKARIEGMEGEYFVNAAEAKIDGSFRHPGFTGKRKQMMKFFENVFCEIDPKPAAHWEDGFRRDTNPDKEIAVWNAIAGHYQYHTKGGNLSLKAKQECLQIILQFTTSGKEHVEFVTQQEELTKDKVHEIIELLKLDQECGEADVVLDNEECLLKGKSKLEVISKSGVSKHLKVLRLEAEQVDSLLKVWSYGYKN